MSKTRILLKNAVNNFAEQYRIYYRKKDWRDFAQKHINGYVLSEDQKKKAIEYYKPFKKQYFMSFIRKTMEVFFVNYIPDDIHYCYAKYLIMVTGLDKTRGV